MKRIQDINRFKLLIGYIFPILFSVFCLLFYVYDETSDEMGIVWDISQSRNATPFYVNKVLALLLRQLYLKIPIVSWWPALLVLANMMALLMICHVAVLKTDSTVGLIIAISIIAVSANLAFFSAINFTRTSMALAAVSGWYILDSLKKKRLFDSYFIIGCIGIVLGGGYQNSGGNAWRLFIRYYLFLILWT